MTDILITANDEALELAARAFWEWNDDLPPWSEAVESQRELARTMVAGLRGVWADTAGLAPIETAARWLYGQTPAAARTPWEQAHPVDRDDVRELAASVRTVLLHNRAGGA